MRRLLLQLPAVEIAAAQGAALIAVGLTILVAAMIYPAVPAVTAMALVALGATGATLARLRAARALIPAMLLHLAIYAGLYALFVGATLHAAATHAAGGITWTQWIDLLVSVVPMAAAAWLSTVAMWKAGGGRPPRSGGARTPVR